MLPALLTANPAAPIVAIVVVAAALGGTWLHGHDVGRDNANNACAASRLESVQRAVKQAQDIAAQDAAVSTEYEATRTVFIERWRDVEIKIPADCAQCRIAPDGLGLLNNARDGKLPGQAATPGQPAPSLSRPATPGGWFVPGNNGVTDVNQRPLQRLSVEAPSVSGTGI